jgi:hypothetical protein
MADLANLKGGVPAASPTERIWGVQKKEKAGDRDAQNRRRALRRESGGALVNEDAGQELERESRPDEQDEEFGYGSRRFKKRVTPQVDVVI